MKKKLLITALLVIVCVLSLCVVASAQTYYVNDSGSEGTYTSVSSAFRVAVDGDTIIIQKDVSDSFNFTKEITYKLEGVEWRCGAGNVADASGKTISVLAIGNENSRFIPNGSCWLNNAGTLGTLHWQFGGENENVRLIFDLSGCNRRLLYPSNNITMTFLPYSDITNYNGNVSDATNDKAIRVKELNVYENVCIYGNRTMSGNAYYVPFIDAGTFNMYGGAFFGNASARSLNGFVVAGNFNMYGGEFFNNYMCASNVGSFINCTSSANIYDGKIYGNHVVGNDNNMNASIFTTHGGSMTAYFNLNNVTNNALYSKGTAFEVIATAMTVGGRELSVYTVDTSALTPKDSYNIGTRVSNYDYSVLFKNADGTIIDAYMVKDGAVLRSVSGSFEITILQGKTWTTKANYCKAVTPVTNAQGTYYVAVEHTCAQNDFNCETGDVCSACGFATEGKAHVIVEKLEYLGGIYVAGLYTYECTNEGCSACDIERETRPIVNCLGFTKSEVGTRAIMQDFVIDKNALSEYNRVNDNDIISYGVVAGIKDNLSGENAEVFENGEFKTGAKAVYVSFDDKGFEFLTIKVTGLEGETESEYLDTELFCCGYFITEQGESYYMTTNEKKQAFVTDTLEVSISFNKISA